MNDCQQLTPSPCSQTGTPSGPSLAAKDSYNPDVYSESFYPSSRSPNSKNAASGISVMDNSESRCETSVVARQLLYTTPRSTKGPVKAPDFQPSSGTGEVNHMAVSVPGRASNGMRPDSWASEMKDTTVADVVTCMTQLGLKPRDESILSRQPYSVEGMQNGTWRVNESAADQRNFMAYQNIMSSPISFMTMSSPDNLNAQQRAIIGQQQQAFLRSCPPAQRAMHETFAMSGMHQTWGHGISRQAASMGGQNRQIRPRPSCGDSWMGHGSRPNYPFPRHILEQTAERQEMMEPKGLGDCKERDDSSRLIPRNGVSTFEKDQNNGDVHDAAQVSLSSGSQTMFDTCRNGMERANGYGEPGSSSLDQIVPNVGSPRIMLSSPIDQSQPSMDQYSRKVFVGGLPPDIDEDEITAAFRKFGPLVVDWPHKADSKSYFPPKGYSFLLFQDEISVQALISACLVDDNKLYWCVSSPTMKDKPVQIRPWNLNDSDFVMDGTQPLDPRKTIFVGGVPRPLRSIELAMIMERLYGGVCYAGIDTDPELKYPKGAGRVAFSNQQSYINAISARFVQLQHADIDKRVEVKPYVLDDQLCDECQGVRCGGKFAPFFCANITCLQYYCESCWAQIHARPGREFHKPLVKEGADRPRSLPFRWC